MTGSNINGSMKEENDFLNELGDDNIGDDKNILIRNQNAHHLASVNEVSPKRNISPPFD